MDNAYKSIYSEFLDSDNEQASEEVRKAYSDMGEAFENYLCFIQEDLFRKAYEFGYAKGVEVAGKRKTA